MTTDDTSSFEDLVPGAGAGAGAGAGNAGGDADERQDGPGRRRRWPWLVAGMVAVVGGVYLADVAVAWGDVPRNTTVAGIAVGGLDEDQAARAIEAAAAEWAAKELTVTVDGRSFTVDPSQVGLGIDVAATLEPLTQPQWNPVTRVSRIWEEQALEPVVTSGPGLDARVAEIAAAVGTTRVDASVRYEGVTPVPVDPVDGRALDTAGAAAAIRAAWPTESGGSDVALPTRVDAAVGTRAMADAAIATLAGPAVAAPVTVTSGTRTAEVQPGQIAAALRFTTTAEGITGALDTAALAESAKDVLAAFNAPAQDARISIVAGTPVIVPAVAGSALPPENLATGLFPALTAPAPRTATVAVTVAEPSLSTEEAQALGVKEKISTFTTYHACCQNRVQNIHAIARILDGHLVLPGETFDLNKVVGKRDRARGFVEAPMISNGEFRNSIGGGISQFATTLFNAVFFSGLKDVEHSPHSYYISRYPPGREATVSWPDPDLIFTNDSPYGVVIDTSYTGRSITVSFYSTKRYDIEAVVGPKRNITRAGTKYITRTEDCNPADGAPGFTITNTRVFKENGAEVKRENFTWTYKPEPKMVCGAPPAQ